MYCKPQIYFAQMLSHLKFATIWFLCSKSGSNFEAQRIPHNNRNIEYRWWRYGVRRILGLKYGFEGLNPEIAQVIELTPAEVRGKLLQS